MEVNISRSVQNVRKEEIGFVFGLLKELQGDIGAEFVKQRAMRFNSAGIF